MLQPVGSQRDGHNLATEQQQNVYVNVGIIGYMFIYLFFFFWPLKTFTANYWFSAILLMLLAVVCLCHLLSNFFLDPDCTHLTTW